MTSIWLRTTQLSMLLTPSMRQGGVASAQWHNVSCGCIWWCLPCSIPNMRCLFYDSWPFHFVAVLFKNDRHRFEILECEFLSKSGPDSLEPLWLPTSTFTEQKHPGTLSPTQPALVGKGDICRILSFHWFQRHQEDLFVAGSEAPSLATSSDKVEAEAEASAASKIQINYLLWGDFFEASLLLVTLWDRLIKIMFMSFLGYLFLIFVIVVF